MTQLSFRGPIHPAESTLGYRLYSLSLLSRMFIMVLIDSTLSLDEAVFFLI